MTRHNAILLLGPTGSGKTPLGDLIEERGLGSKRCAHFDFGAQLRAIDAVGVAPPGLADPDVAFIRKVLREAALLEDEHFRVARAILAAFVRDKGLAGDDLIVLNGLPRHVGQAHDVDALVRVQLVVVLECTAEVVKERIKLDAGGDRGERTDDSLEEIGRKLAIFRERTLPLIEHYRVQGARTEAIEVEVQTRPAAVHARLSL